MAVVEKSDADAIALGSSSWVLDARTRARHLPAAMSDMRAPMYRLFDRLMALLEVAAMLEVYRDDASAEAT